MTLNSVLNRILITLFALTFGTIVHAQDEFGAPGFVDYQGKVFSSADVPFGSRKEGNIYVSAPIHRTMEFRIYDAQSDGRLIWAEHQIVTIDNGVFSVRLGAGAKIVSAPPEVLTGSKIAMSFDGHKRYLEVTVLKDGIGRAIKPRLAFQSSPFSFVSLRAKEAEKAKHADVATKVTDPNVALLDRRDQVFSGTATQFAAPVGVGVSVTDDSAMTMHIQDKDADTATLQIGSTESSPAKKIITFGDPDYVYLGESGTDDTMELKATKYFFSKGDVGIGVATPDEKLVVHGNIKQGSEGQYNVPAAEEKLRILRGRVFVADTASGAGWTATRTSEGVVRIDFTTPFDSIPTVVATGHTSKDNTENYVVSVGEDRTANHVYIFMRQLDDDALWHQPFDFIIMGSY